jgi:ketosteroid isomerase-like protein
MIKKVVELWHRVVAGERPEALAGVLADDVVFYSPIVYTPQRGKDVTTTYLRAAAQTVPGDSVHGAFHDTKQVLAGDVAMLEFETTSAANTSTGSTSSAAMTPGASWSSG